MMKNITPLPISEEMLGAYLEGNLSQYEMNCIESVIQSNSSLADFVNEISVEDMDLDVSIYDEIPNFDNFFELPQIASTENLMLSWDSDLQNNDAIFVNPPYEILTPADEICDSLDRDYSDNTSLDIKNDIPFGDNSTLLDNDTY